MTQDLRNGCAMYVIEKEPPVYMAWCERPGCEHVDPSQGRRFIGEAESLDEMRRRCDEHACHA